MKLPRAAGSRWLSHDAMPKVDTLETFVHPSAVIEENVILGPGVRVWHHCHIRSGARLGRGVTLGKDVYIDANVVIGEFTRIQNGVSVYLGVTLAPWVFVGPHVNFTNDRFPRAGNRNWKLSETILEMGASIGAGATIVCGVTIGSFAMVGAGAIVTKSIAPYRLALGCPAYPVMSICCCGKTQRKIGDPETRCLENCCRDNLHPLLYASLVDGRRETDRLSQDPPEE
jgi:UDP-2-acetamido-3-amino-2,3-dideoxy-glucuronate N-acetyltransferase